MTYLKNSFVMLGLLALATAVLLHGNLTAPFYRIDDRYLMRDAVAGPWITPLIPRQGFMYVPVVSLSWRLERALFGPGQREAMDLLGGERAATATEGTGSPDGAGAAPDNGVRVMRNWACGSRLVNGVYHLLAGFLLWLFLKRIGAGAGIAAVAALAWVVHPAALESVAWICERRNTMCAFFGFGSLLAWTAPLEKPWRLPLVWLLFGLALCSKPAALGYLPLFVALEVADPRQGGFAWRDPKAWLSRLGRLSGQIALSVAACLVAMHVFVRDMMAPPGGTVWTALLTDAEVFFRYTAHVLLPVNLSFYNGLEPVTGLSDPRVWLYGGALALLWGAIIWAARGPWRVLAVLGLVWFFGGLGPNANLIGSMGPLQDRYMYIPSPGLLLGLCAALKSAAERWAGMKPALPAAGVAFVALLAVLCALRSPLYGDAAALVLDAAQRQPDSGMARWSAAQIKRERLLRRIDGASDSMKQEARDEALALIREYEAALACRDICDFVDPLTLRLGIAEVLFLYGDYASAKAALQPVMPPPGPLPDRMSVARLFPGATQPGRGVRPLYFYQSVARAHVLLGEISLREAYLKAATPGERMASARRAVASAEESLAVDPEQGEARVLKGKTLIRIAYLHAAAGAMDEARKAYEAGKEILSSLPAGSPPADAARQILKNVPPPTEGGR
ncbi:MAG: hypothetical protein NTW87_21335 [Planctomycetota bacterium]|nr:hypothetical protein [Planctomycetota bacterium]